jgi:hypothetical protein
MSKKFEIKYEDLHNLLCEAFKQGVASYCDLSGETCADILNDFLKNKSVFEDDTIFTLSKQKTNQTATSTDAFTNYQSFISSVITY